MSEELKPCPFCNQKTVSIVSSHDLYCVLCSNCMAKGGTFKSSIDATRQWNTRHIPEGYALVPLEATEKMLIAAADHFESDEYTGPSSTYRSIIAAAQESE